MHKLCNCGASMQIRLRTVIFQNKVEIDNVPVYSCDSCQRSEVFPPVKSELTGYIRTLGPQPEKGNVLFNELSELAHLLFLVTKRENKHIPIETVIEDRINELLDLLLLAQSLDDAAWLEDVRSRLKQITTHMTATYRLS